jgi:hypothetical protein
MQVLRMTFYRVDCDNQGEITILLTITFFITLAS